MPKKKPTGKKPGPKKGTKKTTGKKPSSGVVIMANCRVAQGNIINDILHGPVKVPQDAIIQALENSMDHMDYINDSKAEAIVVLAKKLNKIYILDRGRGVYEWDRLVSLRDTETPIDKRPGQKRHNDSGLKFSLAICQECKVTSIQETDQKHVYRVSLTEEWYKKVAQSGGEQPIELLKHKVKDDPLSKEFVLPYPHGTQIEFSDINPGQFPSFDELTETLGPPLYTLYKDKVFVAELDKDMKIVNKTKLKKRDIIHDPIRFCPEEEHPLLGRIITEIMVPKEPNPQDELLLGGMGPICSIKMLLKRSPAKFKEGLKSASLGYVVFLHPLLTGIIDCSGLNKYAVHGRDQIDWSKFFPKQDTLTPEAQALSTLLLKLSRMIEKDLEKIISRRKRQEHINLESELLDMIPEIWKQPYGVTGGGGGGVQPPGPGPIKTPPKVIQITPSGVGGEIHVGSRQLFRVYRFPKGCSGYFKWSVSNPKFATISQTQGDNTVVTGIKETGTANYITLHVEDSYNQKNGTNFHGSIKLRIFNNNSFRFHMRKLEVFVGSRAELFLENLNQTSGDIAYEIVHCNNRHVTPQHAYYLNDQKIVVECNDPCVVLIDAWDKQDPTNPKKKIRASIAFRVPQENGKNPFVWVRKKPFRVDCAQSSSSDVPILINEGLSTIDGKIQYTELVINLEDSIFALQQSRKKKGGSLSRSEQDHRRQMVLSFLFREYHRLFEPDAQFYHLMSNLFKEIRSGGGKKKKK